MRINLATSVVLAVGVVALEAFSGIGLAPVKTGVGRSPSPLDVELDRIGSLRVRSSREIVGSPFMVDCSTMDRGMVDFEEIKDYLEPLGAKQIRLQAGWAKTERERGMFDFAWLDRIVDWALERKISIYLETSYGNPIYPGDVYEFPAERQIVHSKGVTFVLVPSYDSPVLITERDSLPFVERKAVGSRGKGERGD